ncbi:MAG: radical SAM protein [Actinomycetota bacterium]|nr:radical SAM protein [Nitrospiraceae bacterium]MDA8157183.1 radical SAM protein [Actinomycetota bacterium]
MKILFINPKHHPHSMNFVHCMDIVGVKYSHLPLSLPTLAALTPADCQVELIDENVEPVPYSTDADIIALTGSVPQRKRVFELMNAFRKMGKFVAVGGPITFDMLEECMEHADAVFTGEAEYTWPQFIRDYRQKKTKSVYRQEEFINMEDSPVPHFHLLKNNQYASACIQVTRGCPNRCDFCDIPVKYGGQPRSKKISQVLQEVRALSSLGHDSIFIVDDNFAGNRPYVKALLKEIAALLPSLPTRMYFYTQATLDVANDEELLALMRDAQFRRLFIGVETGENEELRGLNKRHQSEMDAKRAVEKIRAYGITVWAGIMFGLEGDDKAAFEKRIRFILEADLIPVQVGLLQAIPGTALYRKAADEKRLLKLPSILGLTALSEEELSRGTNLVPRKMSGEELEKNFAMALRAMFSPEVFEIKMAQYLGSGTRDLKSSVPTLNLKTVMILARMLKFYLFRAGAPARKMFFSVTRKLIAKKMQSLDEVVFHLLAYKHLRTHYYKIAEICESRR